ncbi:cardiolipin synthase [Evansella vedderi]|uniref:Cardiolipin synthase n=1 Tax=Evansella vedderi TaxID=38282 RepID=A0ABU0A1M2_9BACI|nr:cardiolipin synthase [Evansella vedderi]MDQ0257389.1 cardiolipin synthase [Evansella vedderi]
MLTILIIIAIVAVWMTLDLYFGKKAHLATLPPHKESPVRKSEAHFFSHGDKLFDHMFQHIDKARDHIHMNFYIFRDDSIGSKMLHKLKVKSREGVTVRLMVDWVGAKISHKERKALKAAGVILAYSHPPKFPYLFFSLNERNHRKITIIDGRMAYIGGYNVGDEYLGRDPKMGRWRDYHLFITGEAVGELQKQFLKDWQGASGVKVKESPALYPKLKQGNLDIKIVPTDGAYVKEKMINLIKDANDSVFIGTPYFIPGHELQNLLIDTARKGINVHVLIPKYPDHPLVKDAAFPYVRSLIKAGVQVRQFYEGFYHSKVVIIDDEIIDIGTANFDKRSFHLNHEINCIIHNDEWIRPVKEEILKDFYESSERITLKEANSRSFFERIKESFAKLVSPFM